MAATSDQEEDYSVPSECLLATRDSNLSDGGISIYPNPAKNELYINHQITQVQKELLWQSMICQEEKALEELTDISEAVNISKLSNGNYVVKGTGIGINFNKKLIIKK